MLDICYLYGGLNNSIVFNHHKSSCTRIGPGCRTFAADMFLGDVKLDWVHTFKYLGTVFNSGSTLNFDISYIRRKLYASCNGILAKCKSADEFVRLSLVKSFCLPLQCYCIGSLDFTSGQIKDLAVC